MATQSQDSGAVTAEHSPLPWRVDVCLENDVTYIRFADSPSEHWAIAAQPIYDDNGNAAFIVTAVNSHEDLLYALKAFGQYDGPGQPLCYDACHEFRYKAHTPKCQAARAAVAKAEGR